MLSIPTNNTLGDEDDTRQVEKEKAIFENILDTNNQGNRDAITTTTTATTTPCPERCLVKYFSMCRKIGAKYNSWTECIENYQAKYKQEKLKLEKKKLKIVKEEPSKQAASKSNTPKGK